MFGAPLVEDAAHILTFGEGAYMVDTGLSHGKPAVFVEPIESPGQPNTFVPKDIAGPLDKLRPGAVAITFPTMEQAEAAADLFCGGPPPAPLIIADPSSVEELGEQSEPFKMEEVEAEEPPQDLPPLFPPEAPKAATPEELEATGVIDPMASYWARKMAKELA